MIILVWHGRGWLTIPIVMVVAGLLFFLFPNAPQLLLAGIWWLCSGIVCWLIGRHLRDNHYRVVTDPQSGTVLKVRQPIHKLFFVPMHFLGLGMICLGIGVIIAFLRHPITPEEPHGTFDASTAWPIFDSPDGDFSATAPDELHDSPQQFQGTTRHRFWTTRSGTYFAIERWDYPKGHLSSQSVDETLDRARDNAQKEGQLLSEVTIILGDNVGREFETTGKKDLLTRCRAFVVGDRLYLVMGVGLPTKGIQQDVQRFLDSFTLVHR